MIEEIEIRQDAKHSDWDCYLFGAVEGDGIVWNPSEKQVPNWFWRKMQYLVFGNRWVRKAQEK
jgi:hypothetical protein